MVRAHFTRPISTSIGARSKPICTTKSCSRFSGDQYGRVLERGELHVRFDAGSFSLNYFDHVFPIAPGTYRYILELALENLAELRDEDFYAEFQSILTALEYLPRRTETDPERIKERAREKEIIKKRLERRCAEAPPVLRAIEKAVETINGHVWQPAQFRRLDELLNAQSYRLAFWRVAAEEINYRRFFDVNDLAAIRMELPEVFDATHKLLFELVAERCRQRIADRSSRRALSAARIFRETATALCQSLAHSVAERRASDLSHRRENSEWRRTVAERLAGPRYDRLRFCQPSRGRAGRS